MFDVNKAIMRCLTKNLAMFGLGLYIYAGEDLPEAEKKETEKKNEADLAAELKTLWDSAGGKEGFESWFKSNTKDGFTQTAYAQMKATLMKKINEKESKA